MITIARFLIAAFAVLRATRLVNQEDGPFDLFAQLRNRVDPKQATWIGRGLRCFYCVSFWLAFPVVIMLPLHDHRQLYSIIPDALAVSGAAALIRFIIFADKW